MGGAGLAPTDRGACGREGPAAGVQGRSGVGGIGGERIRWSGMTEDASTGRNHEIEGDAGGDAAGRAGLPERARNLQLSFRNDVTAPRCVCGGGEGLAAGLAVARAIRFRESQVRTRVSPLAAAPPPRPLPRSLLPRARSPWSPFPGGATYPDVPGRRRRRMKRVCALGVVGDPLQVS